MNNKQKEAVEVTKNNTVFWQQMRAVTRKEFWHLKHDPILLSLSLIFPLVILFLVGFVLDKPAQSLPLVVYDASNDRISEAFINELKETSIFRILPVMTFEEALNLVQTGQVHAALSIPAGALEQARGNKTIEIALHLDGSDPSLGSRIRRGVLIAAEKIGIRLLAGRSFVGSHFDVPVPVKVNLNVLYNPNSREVVYFIPGFIGLIITTLACMLTTLAIVRERESGTLEMLIATPVKPLAVVLGKVIPYFLLGLIVAAAIIIVAIPVFNLPFDGEIWLLVLSTLLFVLVSLGIGIVISAFTYTQLQAMFGTIAYLFPSIFLSGLIFSIDGMNLFFQTLSYAVPLRYFIKVARGVMLRGEGFVSLQIDLIALGILVIVMFLIATLRFRKTL